MKIVVSQAAHDDLLAGFDFYEQQELGVGQYFLDSLFSDIDSLVLFAGVHPVIQGYHRLLASRFPFAVYYKVEDRIIRVWRVLDCRQRPARMRTKLTRKPL